MGVGLLALLDDVATMAKVAAASLDDVAAQATKAGAKAAAVVVDDAAVTPSYVVGFAADRELPIIWKIAKASLRNKVLILMPIAIALGYFLPFVITPILMLGGAYLCYEGAEKIYEKIVPHQPSAQDKFVSEEFKSPEVLEQLTVSGAVRTDLILSAEIMAITLETVQLSSLKTQITVLVLIAFFLTVIVYGVVALIVKMDDVGLLLSRQKMKSPFGQKASVALGRGLVLGMPIILKVLTVVGTIAMTWVGGSIVIHGLHVLGWHLPEELIHYVAEWVVIDIPIALSGVVKWLVQTTLYSIFGVILGLMVLLHKKVIGLLLEKSH